MIELAKHIEVLLLENDCVIVPGLGGFLAHRRTATHDKENNEFCPPTRTIGFNPQLTMNDGLLVQSYMTAYGTDFPDATRKIEKAVQAMKEELYQKGEITLHHVGTLYYSMSGIYTFEPDGNAFFTPSLYGLQSFGFQQLSAISHEEEAPIAQTEEPSRKQISLTRRVLGNAVAVAAAVLLFFVLSVPVENTYVMEADYASLGTEGLFNSIRNRSMATNSLAQADRPAAEPTTENKKAKAIVPVAVKEEKVPARKADATTGATIRVTPKKSQNDSVKQEKKEKKAEKPSKKEKKEKAEKKSSNKYHIIVASLNSAEDARQEVERLRQKGFTNAQTINAENRFRVSIDNFDTQADAYRKANELHQKAGMEAAWVCTCNGQQNQR